MGRFLCLGRMVAWIFFSFAKMLLGNALCHLNRGLLCLFGFCFICFFLEFHPQCAQGILKYLHLIRSAASHFNSPCARVIITDDVMYMSLVTDQKSIIGISIKEGPFQKSLKSRYVSFC